MEGEQKERWLWGPRMSQQLSAFLVIQWQQRSKGKGQGMELEKNKVFQKFTFISRINSMLHVEMSHFRKENTRGSFLIKGWFNIIICLEVANEKKPMHFFLSIPIKISSFTCGDLIA